MNTEYEQHLSMMMKKLHITKEEAIALDKYDSDVNKNKKTIYDLTDEQQAVVRKLNKQVPHEGSKGRSTRKPDVVKMSIVNALSEFFKEDCTAQLFENVTITNPSRTLTFDIDNKSYELNLLEKRKPKN